MPAAFTQPGASTFANLCIYPEQPAHLGFLLVHLAAGVAEVPGEAEVGDLADLVVVHQDVARGEVAVDYLEQG